MPTLPWTVAAPADPAAEAVVLGSRLELKAYRDIPAFFRAAMQIRKQVHDSSGAFGVSLIAQPLRKTFWTLSAWSDQEALDTFVRTAPHVHVMRRFHEKLTNPRFTTWTVPAAGLPAPRSNAETLWTAARQRLGELTKGLKS
jgi:Domain of unknown function (DUF3291)